MIWDFLYGKILQICYNSNFKSETDISNNLLKYNNLQVDFKNKRNTIVMFPNILLPDEKNL